MKSAEPILLHDDAMRRYIADGFIVLDAGLPPETNASIAAELSYCMQIERPPLGDNLLARIPSVSAVMDSPVVRGAMASVLGPHFAWSPHRATHNSEPIAADGDFDPFENGPRLGKGSRAGSGWHQDGHSIAGRSRWHTLRAANVFYFPHDTPVEMGPTRLLAGTHWYANLRKIERSQVVMEAFGAGTVVITDFDIGHAGTPNRLDRPRYMLKFVALRVETPRTPSWDCRDPAWTAPTDLRHRCIPHACASVWNWARGAARTEGIVTTEATHDLSVEQAIDDLGRTPAKAIDAATDLAARGTEGAAAVPALIEAMASTDQDQRLACLYALVAIGTPAVEPLVDALLTTAGQNRHVSPQPADPAYAGLADDPLVRHFSNRQLVAEDAAVALGAIGPPAVTFLVALLDHGDPWMRINAAYALGEAGTDAAGAHADRVGELLDDDVGNVVRAAADALCSLTTFSARTVARLDRLLTDGTHPDHWHQPIMGEAWTMVHQVRFVSCWALLARVTAGEAPPGTVAALVKALDETNGYIPAVACEALRRVGSTDALAAAFDYLSVHRFDDNHNRRMRGQMERIARA